MSIASLTAAAVVSPVGPHATSHSGHFGTNLQSALGTGAAGAAGSIRSAHQTEPGRATPSTKRRHQQKGSDTTPDARTAAAQADPAIGSGQAPTQTPGQLLLSDLRRGLQAYGAVTSLG